MVHLQKNRVHFSKNEKDLKSCLGAGDGGAGTLAGLLLAADTVIVGAGAGLSASAGYAYSGERFTKYFGDFAQRYDFRDMYSGGFYPYETLEEYWAYWSRYIYINRYMDAPRPVYAQLLELIGQKDYFVLTTNVDHCFQRAGFQKARLFYTQGDYGLFQCSKPCCNKTYDNEDQIRQMVERQNHMRIPSELVPHCPVCGSPMAMNLRSDDTFVEDEGWHMAAERYGEFLNAHKNTGTLFLELGCGMNTPGIVKFSFWRMALGWPDAVYACINLNEAWAPEELADRALCIGGDIGDILKKAGEFYDA